eukprot:COSAG02_NODE_25560_length_655_cov_0.820144_1_plen_80_part_10
MVGAHPEETTDRAPAPEEPEPEPELEPDRAKPENETEGGASDVSTGEHARFHAPTVGTTCVTEDGVHGSAYDEFVVAFIR